MNLNNETFIIVISIIIGITLISLVYVFFLKSQLRKLEIENANIEEISSFIREGTLAFLKKNTRLSFGLL